MQPELDGVMKRSSLWWSVFELCRILLYYFALRSLLMLKGEACVVAQILNDTSGLCGDISLLWKAILVISGATVTLVLKVLRDKFKLVEAIYVYNSYSRALRQLTFTKLNLVC